jgi:hypothetical protein
LSDEEHVVLLDKIHNRAIFHKERSNPKDLAGRDRGMISDTPWLLYLGSLLLNDWKDCGRSSEAAKNGKPGSLMLVGALRHSSPCQHAPC